MHHPVSKTLMVDYSSSEPWDLHCRGSDDQHTRSRDQEDLRGDIMLIRPLPNHSLRLVRLGHSELQVLCRECRIPSYVHRIRQTPSTSRGLSNSATALRLILDGSASLERSYERVHDILFPSLRLETLILASQLRGLAGSLGYVSQPAKTVKPDDVRFVRCPYTQSRQSIEPSRHPLQRKETPKRRSRRSVIPARILLDELIPIARGERLILKLMGYS